MGWNNRHHNSDRGARGFAVRLGKVLDIKPGAWKSVCLEYGQALLGDGHAERASRRSTFRLQGSGTCTADSIVPHCDGDMPCIGSDMYLEESATVLVRESVPYCILDMGLHQH